MFCRSVLFTLELYAAYTGSAAYKTRSINQGAIMRTGGLIPAIVLAAALYGIPGLCAAVEVGDKAPDFDLASTQTGKFKLSGMAGKKNVIVQFYVLDFTPT